MRTLALSVALLSLAGCSRPDHIELEPKDVVLNRKGDHAVIRAVAKNRQGVEFPKVRPSWESKDPKVVVVDETGKLSAVGPGTTTVVARHGGMESELMVEVVTIERMTVEPQELKLDMDGGPQRLQIRAFDYKGHELKGRRPHSKCANEEVCTSAEEMVYPSNPGKTTLTVNMEDQTVELPVVVTEKAGKKKK